jgi:tRNA(Leu) C34 or U34 (ribose-2'-O)-methylase TrmL
MEETAAARAQATQQLMTLQASHRQAITRVEHESMCHERQAEAAAAQATEAKSRLLEFGQELHSLTHMHAELQDARLQVCSVPALSLSLSFSLSLSLRRCSAHRQRVACVKSGTQQSAPLAVYTLSG